MSNKKNVSRPLEGILVLDNSWVIAGPHGARLLEDLGATVIRIETSKKRDRIRFDHLRHANKNPYLEAGWIFQENNRKKRGLSLNLKSEEGKRIYYELVKKADVVVSNVTPKALRSMGIDYETISAINPRIISVNASGLGDYGPKRNTMIYATTLNCYAGLSYVVGYENEPGFGIAVTSADNFGGAMLAYGVLCALEARDRTGEGQFIDLSEAENMLALLGPTLLEWTANGTQNGPTGNHPYYGFACPHRAYPCAGTENWLALSCGDDAEWQRLRDAFVNEVPALADTRFDTYEGRKANEAELDALISGYTRRHNNHVLAERLQRLGVSAAPVNRGSETLADEHLNARSYWQPLGLAQTKKQGDFYVSAPTPVLGERDAVQLSPAPTLGQDNDFVLKELLGFSDEEIRAAEADEALV